MPFFLKGSHLFSSACLLEKRELLKKSAAKKKEYTILGYCLASDGSKWGDTAMDPTCFVFPLTNCLLMCFSSVQFSSVAQSCPTLRLHESQHARPPCPSPAPRVHSNSCPSSWWCHPAISSSVVPFSSCPQSLPASDSFPMSQLFSWGGQSTGVSASASFLVCKTHSHRQILKQTNGSIWEAMQYI